ncbi:ABC transporter ATP-binding protein [Niabella hirudinis]|uniref:ABC transporter ATP-binding protein n=1 Tax=Niabella hirudinis TaxID=1285929 RepID=UPI003EBDCD3F
MLEITSLVKRYNSRLILDIPFIQLPKGIYWLKGENGSGKTTFLKMMAALIPFRGDIVVNHTSQSEAPLAYRKQISWAEAEPLYPAFLTGQELIALYQQIRKVSDKEVASLIRLFGAGPFVSQKAGTYSAGMLKKISLILAFMGTASLILLDEPFITLDAAACALLTQTITERHKTQHTSFILSSHQDPGPNQLACKELFVNNQTVTR